MEKLTNEEAQSIAQECLRGSTDEKYFMRLEFIKRALVAVSEEFWEKGLKHGQQYLSSH